MIHAIADVDHLEVVFGVTMTTEGTTEGTTGGTTFGAAGSAMENVLVTVKRDTRDGMRSARTEVSRCVRICLGHSRK